MAAHKPLADGSLALALLNRGSSQQDIATRAVKLACSIRPKR